MSDKKDSRLNYQELFNAMTEGFALQEIICDENGEPYDYRFLEINPAFELLTGMKKEDVVGKTYRELLPNPDPLWIKACCAVALTGQPQKFENYSPDLKRHYEVTAFRPAPGQFAAMFIDISERKRIEEDLLKSEAKSRGILDSIPDLIFHVAPDGTFLDYRAPPSSDLYASPKAFLGKKMQEVLPPDLASQAAIYMKQAQKTGALQIFEFKLKMGDKEFVYEARISVCSEEGFIALVRDISEHKRMEVALFESERRLRAAVDSVPYYFAIFDRELRFRYANRAAVEMIGLPEEKIFGHTNEELFSPDIIRPYIDHLRRALETRCTQRVEHTHDIPSGNMTLFTIYVPLLNEKGNVIQILGISHDITKMKDEERRLKSTLDENKKQTRLLKTVFEELSGNYKEIEQLLYKISHDLITPLVTIEGFLDLLKKDVEKCNRIRIEIDLGLIDDAVSRMQKLVGDALELSSLGMSTKPAERIHFEEILNDAREHFKNTGTANHLVITEDENFPLVYINRKKMVDVLASMIECSIRYSGESCSPRVHVGWRTQDDGPVFFTSTPGRGELKDSSQASKICCSKESADNGTSIGLAISKRIIELQGGRMWMECGTEEGCTILFTLPEGKNAY